MSNSGKAILAGVIMALATSPLLADTDAKIKARLEKLLPEYTIDSIGKTPIGGLFEVVMPVRRWE